MVNCCQSSQTFNSKGDSETLFGEVEAWNLGAIFVV